MGEVGGGESHSVALIALLHKDRCEAVGGDKECGRFCRRLGANVTVELRFPLSCLLSRRCGENCTVTVDDPTYSPRGGMKMQSSRLMILLASIYSVSSEGDFTLG